MAARLGDWLDQRTGHRSVFRHALDEPVPGGASFAYVFGSVLVLLLLLQFATGILLAMTYSASATDAWASVAYIQDQSALGWFVRGLHSHGASAMVIVAGLHMLQTALWGAYKKPRELNWMIGVLLMGLLLAFALTGYLLPWDQTGYWATKVATGIAGTTPLIGEQVQAAIQGGNEYGNLTLTRFYALHVLVLPGALVALVAMHLVLFRRHGVTPHWWLDRGELERRTARFWPDQLLRDTIAAAAAFAVLVGVNLYTGGAPLDGPADPAAGFDARPEWYFRPLFQALKYFGGPMERVVSLGMPVLLGGFLLALPLLDRADSRSPRRRRLPLGALAALFLLMAGLTVVSVAEDAADPRYQEALARAEDQARRARQLAFDHGVPPAGGTAVFTTERFYRARQIWRADCAACHEGAAREGPEIAAGYNSRAWIRDFLLAPSGPRFFGPTEKRGMDPVEQRGRDLDALVELVYAESGAADVDARLVELGRELFTGEGKCAMCHEIDGTSAADIGPNLGGRGSLEMLAEFIGRPDHPRWFGDEAEMPSFYDKYDGEARRELAELLVHLGAKTVPKAPPPR